MLAFSTECCFFRGLISYYLSFSELLMQVGACPLSILPSWKCFHPWPDMSFAQWCFCINGFIELICFKAKVIPCSTLHTWFVHELWRGEGCSSCHALPAPLFHCFISLCRSTLLARLLASACSPRFKIQCGDVTRRRKKKKSTGLIKAHYRTVLNASVPRTNLVPVYRTSLVSSWLSLSW